MWDKNSLKIESKMFSFFIKFRQMFISGFIVVTAVNMEEKKLTVLSPQPRPLPVIFETITTFVLIC